MPGSITGVIQGFNNLGFFNPTDEFNLWKGTAAPDVKYWGTDATKAEKVGDWSSYDPTAAPVYKGMSNGDYDSLQKSLQTPGDIAAQRAYEQARKTLSSAANNRGMYGSSNYTNQMVNQADQPYMDTLAKNAASAAAQRYNMQQQDQQFGQTQAQQAWGALQQLLANQNLAQNQYRLNQATLNNQATLYNNNLLQGAYNDAWMKAQWDSQEKNRLANLLFNYANNANMWQDATAAKQLSKMDSQSNDGLGSALGGLGSVIGGGMSSGLFDGLLGGGTAALNTAGIDSYLMGAPLLLGI